MRSREAFFQRVSASLIVPITFLPLAAILLAVGAQGGIGPVEAAGLALIRSWLPLFYGIGVAIGFANAEAMGALSVATGFLVMVSVAEAVSGDPKLSVGVLGGLVAGALCTWIYNRVKRVELPEYLGLFSGKRMGPMACSVAGIGLGYLFGLFWPPLQAGIIGLGEWIYSAGGLGAFVYGSVLRLLIPTGLHHILMQVVDTQMGGWVDPATGKLVAGEYLRFLAGDPAAGRITSGFFVSLGFGPAGAAMAITQEARPEQRRRVAGLMTTGALTAGLLGVTEPIEFAFIFASPVLFGVHVLLSGLASFLGWALDIHHAGYALPMMLINGHRSANGLLLIPFGLAYTALYYFSFRAVIRWLRPPILGQTADAQPEAPAKHAGDPLVAALGGAANLTGVDACMTRLRLTVHDVTRVDEAALKRLGAAGVLFPGGGAVQVVVGARAGALAQTLTEAMGRAGAPAESGAPASRPAPPTDSGITVVSPLTGRVVPLAEVPDPVFAGGMAGEGVAVEPTDGRLRAPVSGTVALVFPGGHALGIVTPEGLELLVHVGIDTVALQGEGFRIDVAAGDMVNAGQVIGQVDLEVVSGRGKSLITPVLVTNPDALSGWEVVTRAAVQAGNPLLLLRPRK